MSIEHVAVVLHHSKARGTNKLVLVGIANHAGDGGAWPSIATLAKYANVSPRNAQKAVARLVADGEVVVRYQAGGTTDTADHRRPNCYSVTVTCPPWCDRSPRHRDTRPTAGPQVGMDLWINPLSESTPPVGIDTPPLSESTPLPLSHATPEPSLEPTLNPPVSHLPTSLDTRACRECSQPEARCRDLQRPLRPADRHTYQPRDRHAAG